MPNLLDEFFTKRNHFIRKYPVLRKLFVGKNNSIVIIQWPNIPLATAIALAIISMFLHAPFQAYAHYGYVIAILVWAGMEVATGDSLFRKLLGVAVVFDEIIQLLR